MIIIHTYQHINVNYSLIEKGKTYVLMEQCLYDKIQAQKVLNELFSEEQVIMTNNVENIKHIQQ